MLQRTLGRRAEAPGSPRAYRAPGRAPPARLRGVPAAFAVAALGLLQCSDGARDEGALRWSSQAIVGGSMVDGPDSPVLYMRSSMEGACSAVLVAPTLVATARHCVAISTPGTFSCTASGDVVNTGNGAGQMGADNSPDTLDFYTAASWATNGAAGAPDAVGMQIISTQSPTSCRDDLAFVVLDRPLPGLVPAPIRVSQPTSVGEAVSVLGFGLTDHVEATALRIVDSAISGVGPDTPATTTQPAPLRAVRLGPVTCLGDSGGPVLSKATGAVVAIVSLGSQVGSSGPYCSPSGQVDTTGPRLAAYHDWIVSVFQVAGAAPNWENSPVDAAADSTAQADASVFADAPSPIADASAAEASAADAADAATRSDDEASLDDAAVGDSSPAGEAAVDPPGTASGSGCACFSAGRSPRNSRGLGAVTVALAWTAAAVGRRRR